MGRDEHRNPSGKKSLGQTPKSQIVDGKDVEFSEELADADDKEAEARAAAARERARKIQKYNGM